VEGTVDLARLRRYFPLAVNTTEAPRPRDLAVVDNLEQIFSTQRSVYGLRHVAGPWQGFDDDLVETEQLGRMIAAMKKINAHRRRQLHGPCQGRQRGEDQQNNILFQQLLPKVSGDDTEEAADSRRQRHSQRPPKSHS